MRSWKSGSTSRRSKRRSRCTKNASDDDNDPLNTYDRHDIVMEIDLNADLGEGCGTDEALLDLVSSANIACG